MVCEAVGKSGHVEGVAGLATSKEAPVLHTQFTYYISHILFTALRTDEQLRQEHGYCIILHIVLNTAAIPERNI